MDENSHDGPFRPPWTHPSRQLVGLPTWAVGVLALLPLPGIALQDLGVAVAPWASALLAVVPFVVWVGAGLAARVETPVPTLLAVGGTYGFALGASHNLLRTPTFVEQPPLDAEGAELVLRLAVVLSSVFTGFMMGVVTGLCALALRRLWSRLDRR